MPDTRYFLLGDLLANATTGLIVALCTFHIFTPSWSMFPAMLLGMVLGMVIAMVLAVAIFMRFFGAMEIMLPTMLGGMGVGMIVAMRASMGHLALLDACVYGILFALLVLSLCWALNTHLRQEKPPQSNPSMEG